MTPRTTTGLTERANGRTAGPVTGEAAHFARSFAALPTPAFLVDGRGEFVWVNQAFAALAGMGEQDGEAPEPGRGAARGDLPDGGYDGLDYDTDSAIDSDIGRGSVADLAARSADVLRTGLPLRVEKVQFRQPTGGPRWATGSAFALPTEDGMLAAGTFHELGLDAADDLARLLAGTPVQVLTTDLDLRYTWAAGGQPTEPTGPAATGEALVGRTAWDVAGSSDAGHPWVAPLLRALTGERAHQRTELAGRHLDQWVGPLRDHRGETVGTVAVVVDVTDAVRAGTREEVAEEKFRRVLDNSPALIDVRDGDDRIVQANPAFLRTFGVRLPDVIGYQPATDDLPGGPTSDMADLIETGRRVRESGRPRIWQGRVPHPDGESRDLLGHVFPLPGPDGADGGVGEVFVDITAQERARRELAESEQRFRALFTGAEIGVLMIALDGAVRDANPAALRLTGRALHELRGRPLGSALAPVDVERHAPLWAELVAGRRGRYDLTVTVRSSDSRQRPARLTVTLVRSTRGAPALGLALVVPLAPENETVGVPARSVPSAGEAAVLERLAAGASLQQIASDQGMSRRGVDYRITRLRHKLRADGPGGAPTNSAALIARAYALGILHPAVWPPRVADLQQPDDAD
jgi:PAS domain S-box-containing protein